MKLQGAIFDMDGTVLDSMQVWDRLSETYLKQLGVHITAADYAAVEGGTQLGVAQYFVHTYRLPMTAEEMVTEMNALITARYEAIARPKAGVLDFLEALRARRIPCCIATLTDRHHAEKALRDRDMLRYFDFMLTIEDVGVSKYEPAIYLRAAERMGCAAADCMVFEDAPYAAATAKRAGFQVCGVIERAYADGEALLRESADIILESSFDQLKNYNLF